MITDLVRRHAVDGIELAWDRFGTAGDAAPLVLCHGFSGSSDDFALVIEHLAESREVVTLDLRGHGRSGRPGTSHGYTLVRLAADLVDLLDAVADRPVDLLGHSMGGALSLRVALARPDLLRSLVLMDTSAWSFRPADPAMQELYAQFFETFDASAGQLPDLSALDGPETALIAAATPPAWQEQKARMSAAFDPTAMKALGHELTSGEVSVRDRLGEITCPVTVVVGEHDEPFVSQASELSAALPDGALTVIAGAYHSPQLTHRQAWLSAVEGHLART